MSWGIDASPRKLERKQKKKKKKEKEKRSDLSFGWQNLSLLIIKEIKLSYWVTMLLTTITMVKYALICSLKLYVNKDPNLIYMYIYIYWKKNNKNHLIKY